MSAENLLKSKIVEARAESYAKAIDALGRYKFWMFGYHAAQWVKLNRLLPEWSQRPNPFRALVHVARDMKVEQA